MNLITPALAYAWIARRARCERRFAGRFEPRGRARRRRLRARARRAGRGAAPGIRARRSAVAAADGRCVRRRAHKPRAARRSTERSPRRPGAAPLDESRGRSRTGRIVAERYADGYGVDAGAGKLGHQVGDQRARRDPRARGQAARRQARRSPPGQARTIPRRAITIDQLLRADQRSAARRVLRRLGPCRAPLVPPAGPGGVRGVGVARRPARNRVALQRRRLRDPSAASCATASAAPRRTCCASRTTSCSRRSAWRAPPCSSIRPARRSARAACSRRRVTGRASGSSSSPTGWRVSGASCRGLGRVRATTPSLDAGYGAGFLAEHHGRPDPAVEVRWGITAASRDAYFARLPRAVRRGGAVGGSRGRARFGSSHGPGAMPSSSDGWSPT